MNTTTTFAAIALVTSLGTVNLNADDPIFEVSAFITGIDGGGFAGNEETGEGPSWSYPENQSGEYYVHTVDGLPLDFEGEVIHPDGATTNGTAAAETEITSTSVEILAVTTGGAGIESGGDPNLYTQSYSQVHGEFHLSVDDGANLYYRLCGITVGSGAFVKIYIRKLVNGNFQTMFEQVIGSNSPALDCLEGEVELEPGFYQLYFSTYSFITNEPNAGPAWESAGSALQANLEFSPLPSIADINGDGKVDGIDLGRLLGAWGSSAGGGDLNGDGTVDGQDLAILLGEWTG
jgi:hypothetical protein